MLCFVWLYCLHNLRCCSCMFDSIVTNPTTHFIIWWYDGIIIASISSLIMVIVIQWYPKYIHYWFRFTTRQYACTSSYSYWWTIKRYASIFDLIIIKHTELSPGSWSVPSRCKISHIIDKMIVRHAHTHDMTTRLSKQSILKHGALKTDRPSDRDRQDTENDCDSNKQFL